MSNYIYTGASLVANDSDYEWTSDRIRFPAELTTEPEDLSQATLLATLLTALHSHPSPSTIHIPDRNLLHCLRRTRSRPHPQPTIDHLLSLARPLLTPHVLRLLPPTRAKKLNLTAPLPVQAAFVLPHIAGDTFLDSWRSPLRWRDIQTVSYAPALLSLQSRPFWATTSGQYDLRDPITTISELRRIRALTTRDLRSADPRWTDSNIPHGAQIWRMATSDLPNRARTERLLHERHWLVRPRPPIDSSPLPSPSPQPICSLCGLALSYRHVLQECQHTAVRTARDSVLVDIDSYLEPDDPPAELYRHILHLTRQPGGHSILLGNWRTPQVEELGRRLNLIEGFPMPDLPRHLSVLQAKFTRLTSDTWTEWRAAVLGRPSPPRYLRPGDRVYAVKRGRSPGLYYSAAEARAQTQRFGGAITRTFSTVAEATAFMAIPIDPPPDLDRSNCHEAYTDGSCKGVGAAAKAGWGFVALPPASDLPLTERSGPVLTSPDQPGFLGALKHSNNTAELSAIGQALTWALSPEPPHITTLLLYSDSELALQKVFLPPRSDKPAPHKDLSARVRQLYITVLANNPVFLIWTKGHDHTGTRSARWNAVADSLAEIGRLTNPQPDPPTPSPRSTQTALPPLPVPADVSPSPTPDAFCAASPSPSPLTGAAVNAPREGIG